MTRKIALLPLLAMTGCGAAATQGASLPVPTSKRASVPASAKPSAATPVATGSVQAPATTSRSKTLPAGTNVERTWYPVGNLAPWTVLLAERFPAARISRAAVVPAVIAIPRSSTPQRRCALQAAPRTAAHTPSAAAPSRGPRPAAVSFARLKSRTDELLRKWTRHQVSRAPVRVLLADIRRAAAHTQPKARAPLAGLANRLAAALRAATKPAKPAARKPAARKPAAHRPAHPAQPPRKAQPKRQKPQAKATKPLAKPSHALSSAKRPASARH